MRWTLLLLGLAACDASSVGALPNFGDAYTVLDGLVLEGDLLEVPVQSSGGCEDHTFAVNTRSVGTTTELWLTHDANGDLCEALVTDTVAVDLEGVAGAVVLLAPDGRRVPVRD